MPDINRPISCGSKVTGNVKVQNRQRDRQRDRKTDRYTGQKQYAPIVRYPSVIYLNITCTTW